MAQKTHAISSETFAAWLLRARPEGLQLAAIARSGFAEIEVLKMPAGSNQSYLDTEQYRCLLEAFPQPSPR